MVWEIVLVVLFGDMGFESATRESVLMVPLLLVILWIDWGIESNVLMMVVLRLVNVGVFM